MHCDWLLYCCSTNEKYLLLTLLWGPEKLYYWVGHLWPYLSVPSGMESTHCSGWHHSKCIICLPCILQILHLQSFQPSRMTAYSAHWNVNSTQPCSEAKPSAACICPGMTECKRSIQCLAQHELILESFTSITDPPLNPHGPRPAAALSLWNPMQREVTVSNDPGIQL